MSKLESLILRRAGEVTHVKVADALGKDTSTVSRIFGGSVGVQLADLEKFFDAINLQVVEIGGDTVEISADEYRALQVLARKSLKF